MFTATEAKALKTLFNLGRAGVPADLAKIAEATGTSCVEADAMLETLASRGLVDVDRVRLTMTGLVMAINVPTQAQKPHLHVVAAA